MSRFVVQFMKDVLGENGRETEICQSALEVDASNEGQATELAKKKFCEMQALCDWSLHADRIQVRAADFPILKCPLWRQLQRRTVKPARAFREFRKPAATGGVAGVQVAIALSIGRYDRPRLSATALLVI